MTDVIPENLGPFSPAAVANEILIRAKQDGEPITQIKLMKLVYICHGWHLAIVGRPLLNERVRAWQFGPVLPSLYHEFKRFGSRPIKGLSVELTLESGDDDFLHPRVPGDAEYAHEVIDQVWSIYGGLSASQLVKLTHADDSPWFEAFDHRERNIVIDDAKIAEHYRYKLSELMEKVEDEPQYAAVG